MIQTTLTTITNLYHTIIQGIKDNSTRILLALFASNLVAIFSPWNIGYTFLISLSIFFIIANKLPLKIISILAMIALTIALGTHIANLTKYSHYFAILAIQIFAVRILLGLVKL